jgi:hypothetical protein
MSVADIPFGPKNDNEVSIWQLQQLLLCYSGIESGREHGSRRGCDAYGLCRSSPLFQHHAT